MLNIQQLLANGVSPEALRNLQNGDAVGFGGAPASGTGPNIKANMAPPANFWSEASEPGGNPQFNMGAPGLQETQPGQTPAAPPPQQQPPQQQPPQAQPQQGNPAPNNWSAYLQSNPDVAAAYNSNIGGVSDRYTPEQFGQFHYSQFGRNENRSQGGNQPAPTQPQQPQTPAPTQPQTPAPRPQQPIPYMQGQGGPQPVQMPASAPRPSQPIPYMQGPPPQGFIGGSGGGAAPAQPMQPPQMPQGLMPQSFGNQGMRTNMARNIQDEQAQTPVSNNPFLRHMGSIRA